MVVRPLVTRTRLDYPARVIRDDLSNRLVHLVKGKTPVEAFNRFVAILHDGVLLGGTGYIKSGELCVCFTETPLAHLAHAMSLRDATGLKYFPAGVMDKYFSY